jgi:hypothetical protein
MKGEEVTRWWHPDLAPFNRNTPAGLADLEELHVQAQPEPWKAGTRIDLLDQRGTTRVDGRFERMGPDDGRGRGCVAAERGDSFHVEGGRWELSQVKDATEKAGFLLVAFRRAACLEL